MKSKATKIAASVMLLGLVAASCTSKSTTASTTSTSAGATTTVAGATTTATAATTTVAAGPSPELQWALDYLGVKAAAAPAGEPITIGYVNDEKLFPEATIGANAAVAYINAELGGIAGHELKLDSCDESVEEDGLKCGQQLANNDKIKLVITGAIVAGNQTLYDTLKGANKTVFEGNPLNAADLLNASAYTFNPGSAGVVQGMAIFVKQQFPNAKKVAVVNTDNSGGQFAVTLVKGVFDKIGVEVSAVPVKDTDGATQIAAAMSASGADKADVFIPLVGIAGCIASYDAIKSLGIKPVVVTSGLCFGTPMSDHLKQSGVAGIVPDSWYYGGYGYSYFVPDAKSGMNTYLQAVQKYGKAADGKTLEYTGFAGPTFGTIMTAVKFANALGDGKVDGPGFVAQAQAFTGPQMIVVGPMACGKQPIFKPVCGIQMGIQQYKDGKWISIADGANGKPIDPSAP